MRMRLDFEIPRVHLPVFNCKMESDGVSTTGEASTAPVRRERSVPEDEERQGSTIVDRPEVPEDRDPAQREAEGPRSSMDYSEFPLLDFSHQKKNGAPASPHRVTAVLCDGQWKGQRSRWRYMEQWEKTQPESTHRLQLSRNLRDSPGFIEFVPENLLEVVQHLSKL